jgi:hypothetical protein
MQSAAIFVAENWYETWIMGEAPFQEFATTAFVDAQRIAHIRKLHYLR